MLGLRLNETKLDLQPDFAISFEWINHIFELNETAPSFTYPITLPATATNKKAFNYPAVPASDVNLDTVYDNAAITFQGNDFFKGLIEVITANQQQIKISFRFGQGFLTTKFADKKLADMFQGQTIDMTLTGTNKIMLDYTAANGVANGFYITIATVTVGAAAEVEGITPTIELAAQAAVAQWPSYFTGYESNGEQLFLTTTATPPLSSEVQGEARFYFWPGPDPAPANIEDWNFDPYTAAVSNVASTVISSADLGTKYVLPTMKIPGLYDDKNENWTGWVNYHQFGAYQLVPPANALPANHLPYTFIPCLLNKWVLETLMTDLGLSVGGAFLQDAELSRRFFFVARPIDQEIKDQSFTTPFNIQVPVSDLLPEMTVGQFINSLKKEFGLVTYFNPFTNQVNFEFIKDLFQSAEFDNWTDKAGLLTVNQNKYQGLTIGYVNTADDTEIKDKVVQSDTFVLKGPPVNTIADLSGISSPAEPDVYLVRSVNAFYKYNGSSWQFFAHNLDSYRDEEEVLPIISDFTPLVDETTEEGFRKLRTPIADTVGHVPFFDLVRFKQQPRFSVYRNMQADNNGNTYPMASITRYKQDETLISGENYDFTPQHNAASTVLTFHSELQDFWKNSKVIETTVRLKISEINRLDLTKKKRINGVDYFIKQISGQLNAAGVSVLNVALYRLNGNYS